MKLQHHDNLVQVLSFSLELRAVIDVEQTNVSLTGTSSTSSNILKANVIIPQ